MARSEVGRVKLGSQGFEVSALGLGCMGMSIGYGLPKPEEDMVELIRHAVGTGVTFLDTSDIYGPFTNEILIGKVGGFQRILIEFENFGLIHNVLSLYEISKLICEGGFHPILIRLHI